MKYQKKREIVEAYTWDEMIEMGREICISEGRESNIVNGMPWSFAIGRAALTHENDECYLVNSSTGFCHRMTPKDMLVVYSLNDVYPVHEDLFHLQFEEMSGD